MLSIEVDYDVVEKVIRAGLKETLEDLALDYAEAVATGRGKVFSTDGAEDAKKLKKMIKYLVRVHNWYTPQSEKLEIKDYV